MRLKLNCRETTRLVLEGEDRDLALAERLAVRLHLMICKTCPTFARQVRLMRNAMGQWRRHVDDGPDTSRDA